MSQILQTIIFTSPDSQFWVISLPIMQVSNLNYCDLLWPNSINLHALIGWLVHLSGSFRLRVRSKKHVGDRFLATNALHRLFAWWMMCLKAALDIRVSISPYGLFKIQAVKQQLKLYVQPLKPRPHGMGRACVQNGVGGCSGHSQGSGGRSGSGVQNSWLFYETLTQPLCKAKLKPRGHSKKEANGFKDLKPEWEEERSRTFQHWSNFPSLGSHHVLFWCLRGVAPGTIHSWASHLVPRCRRKSRTQTHNEPWSTSGR